MPFSFPSSPTVGDQSTQNGRLYQWTGTAWELVATPAAIDGAAITTGTVAAARLGTHATTHNPGGADPVTLVEAYEFTRTTRPAAATGSNGSYSFTIPAAAKMVEFFAIGAGGGGGSGRRGAATTARFGGGGGGSAGVMLITRTVADMASRTVSMTIGAGGAGGAAVTANDTNGNTGSNGVDTSLTISGVNMFASRGNGGGGGTAAAGAGGSGGQAQYPGTTGSASSATTTPSGGNGSAFAASGGGAGGGISTADVSFAGSIARAQGWLVGGALANANAGTAPGGAGQNADAAYTQTLGAQPGGSGGGGGAGNASTAGGNGGNGANYGGAGGGGGASVNGFSSGAGGNGGDGFVRITVWY